MPEVLKSVSRWANDLENSFSITSPVSADEENGFQFIPLPALTKLLRNYSPAIESLGSYTPSSPPHHPSPLLRDDNPKVPPPVKNEYQQKKPRRIRKRRSDRSDGNQDRYLAANNFRFCESRQSRRQVSEQIYDSSRRFNGGLTENDIGEFAASYVHFVKMQKNRMTIAKAREFGGAYAKYLIRRKAEGGSPF